MIDTGKYEGHTPAPWKMTVKTGAFLSTNPIDMKLIFDAPLLLEEVKRLREELFDTHAFYSIMEQKLAFAVGVKQGLLTNMTMDDLVDSMNRDYHDRLNEHMNGRLRK
tara:strand:- start:217 stop:540 length:324 start_codon:yes stop_codon:yes gene_type:complete